jgi:hypothetical protein
MPVIHSGCLLSSLAQDDLRGILLQGTVGLRLGSRVQDTMRVFNRRSGDWYGLSYTVL